MATDSLRSTGPAWHSRMACTAIAFFVGLLVHVRAAEARPEPDQQAAAAAKVESIPAVLDLPDDGFLVGALADAPSPPGGKRETFLWQSPTFSEPFEFALDAIQGIRFPLPVDELPAGHEGSHVELVSGDALVGEIESINDESVVVVIGSATAPIRVSVNREAVARVVRLGRGAPFIGPGGLSGWQASPAGAWREQAESLASEKPSQIFRHLGCGPRCRYDLTLSWSKRPSVEVALGIGGPQGKSAYGLDLKPDGFVATREEEGAANLEPCGQLPEQGISLSVFVDEQTGRMAVMLPGVEKPVADLRIAPSTQRAGGGFRLALREGAVVLEAIRVSPWVSAEPSLDTAESPSIRLNDGSLVAGRVTTMDRTSGFGVVEGDGKGADSPTRRIPAEQIAEIVFGTGTQRQPGAAVDAKPSLRVTDLWGSNLSGNLSRVEHSAIVIAHPAIDGPVTIPVVHLSRLTSLRRRETTPAMPGRIGRLESDTARMRGCLVPGGKGGAENSHRAAVAWQPVGSVTASLLESPVDGGSRVTITYAEPGTVGGIGANVTMSKEGAVIAGFVGQAPAGIEQGNVIVEIAPLGDGRFVKTAGLPLADVQNLLRGEVGSPVCLRCSIEGVKDVKEIRLKRTPFPGAPSLLTQAAATQDRLLAASGDAAPNVWSAVLFLRTGDTLPCRVDSISEQGVRLTLKGAETVTIPHEFVQALEFIRTSRAILPKEKFRGLTTLPRNRETDPPTHLMRSRSGDYIRGRILSLDKENLRMSVEAGKNGQAMTCPRADLALLIWMRPENVASTWEPPDPPADGHLPVEAESGETTRVRIMATGIEGTDLAGTNIPIGPIRIDLETVRVLLLGRANEGAPRVVPFSQWQLKLAADPRNLPPRKRAADAVSASEKPSATDEDGDTETPHRPTAERDRAAIDAASLAEANRLANARDRRAVTAYASLLMAEDRSIRARSIEQLRAITGSTIPYAADDTPAKREAAAREWRRWAARQAVSAPLQFP